MRSQLLGPLHRLDTDSDGFESAHAPGHLYRLAFEAAPSGLAVSTTGRRLLEVNSALADLLGWTTGELLSLPTDELIHPDDRFLQLARFDELVAGRRRSYSQTMRLRHRDGHLLWAEVHVALAYPGPDAAPLLILQVQDITARKLAEERAAWLAHHDPLTGAANRTLLQERLAEMLPSRPAVLFVDVDRFKRINDTLGHLQGDSVLVAIAGRIRSQLQDIDVLARMGGDEFVVLLAGADADATRRTAQGILDAVAPLSAEIGCERRISVSIGMAVADDETTQQLLGRADDALYRAKAAGRNSLSF